MTAIRLLSIFPFSLSDTKNKTNKGPVVSSKLTAGTVVKPTQISKAKRLPKTDWAKFQALTTASFCVAIAVLAFFYAIGVNSYAAKGYEIKKLQASVNQKMEENKRAAVRLAEQSSILEINSVASQANLVQVTGEEYLQMPQANQLSRR